MTLSIIIIDDEAPARTRLRDLLADAMGEVPNEVVAEAANGELAIEAMNGRPIDVALVDIRMPGMDGIELARHLSRLDRPPTIIFVTAYDNYAIPAFEHSAVDYLLKPATAERLKQTVDRLKARLAQRAASPQAGDMAALMQRMQAIAKPEGASDTDAGERIKVIRAGVGNTVRMIPVADVVCFEANEKYVNVVTPTGDALVRMSLRELMARIDSTDFIQVHRSVMVNSSAILSATRDENGHYSLSVRGLQRPLKVSRAFGHLFRPM